MRMIFYITLTSLQDTPQIDGSRAAPWHVRWEGCWAGRDAIFRSTSASSAREI
jgi:hypothetical protein